MAEPKKPPPLSKELLQYFGGLLAPTQRQTSGTQYERDGFMPVFDTSWAASPESAAGNDDQPGNLVNIVGPGFNPKDPNNHAAYDKDTGEFSHWYTANTGVSPEVLFALATGGLMMLPGGLLAGAVSGGAGAGMAGAEGAGALAGGAAGDALGAGLLEAGAGFGGAELGTGMFLDGGAMLGMGSGSMIPTGASLTGAAPGFMGGMGGSELAIAGAGLPSGGGSGGNWLSDLLPNGTGDAAGKYGSKILGSVLGAVSSEDQQQTSSKEPWGPTQEWLKQNIATGQQLQQHYQDSPLNDIQKQGLQGLLDVNRAGMQGLPGLLNFGRGLGQTNYQRSGGRDLAYNKAANNERTGPGFAPSPSAPAVDWTAMNPWARKV